jgi:5-methyltetrahydrofolate--homocysteine methyltransferase
MIIVGELINASRKAIAEAIEKQDAVAIQKVATDQHENGADYIDVNAGVFVGQEVEYLKWLVPTVQAVVDAPCSIDSPDPKAIEAALQLHKGTAMINSISLEKERYNSLLPIVAGTDLKVVALCMSDEGMPGLEFLRAIEKVMTTFEGIHTLCGLSNISFGLPERKFLNQTFMIMAIANGLDGAIVNPLDKKMMASIIAAEALVGKDEYCANYLTAYRAKKFEI